jgi:hypothetical protein
METNFEWQPTIEKFVIMFETFLESMLIPHYSCFTEIKQQKDKEYLIYIMECSSDFTYAYIRCNLDHTQKHKIIAEYGMKKLIDLQVSYEGNSICEELLNLDEHIDTWLHSLLMNVVMLY